LSFLRNCLFSELSMNTTAFVNMTIPGFPSLNPSGTTGVERLSGERQSELYVSEIKRAAEGIESAPIFEGQNTESSNFRVPVRKKELIGQNSWPEELIGMELLLKFYIYELLNSWKCKIEVNDLISRIWQSAEITNAEKIALRLDQLRKISEEEQPDSCTMSSDSIRGFMKFLSLHPRVRHPDITLTPSGNIYARWKGSHRSLVSIQFLPDLKVRFVIFAPNQRHPEELNRVSGIDFVDTVMDNLSGAYGVYDWIME